LNHPAGDFPGWFAQGGDEADEQFINDIGGLFPIALWVETMISRVKFMQSTQYKYTKN